MKQEDLNKELREQARTLGLCDKWYDEWDPKSDNNRLVEKYVKGIDFCIKNDYPTLDFIKENFDVDFLSRKGIFVDQDVDVGNVPTVVMLGTSKGVLKYEGFNSCNVYLRHDSQTQIEIAGGAKIFVECYDKCILDISTDNQSKAFVYWHGGEVNIKGNVLVRDKRKAGC